MLERDVVPGAHRIAHAPVNCYLIEGEHGLLLVDAGLPGLWHELGLALRPLGHRPEDVRARSRRSPSTGPTIAASGPLSQLGGTWPSDGRKIGIVVDPEADNTDLLDLHEAIVAASMTPLVIAPRGGEVAGVPVGRTLATAASVELDALLLAGNALLAPDSRPSVDAKAGAPGDGTVEPRVGKLIDECWRHSKVIGAWGPGRETLEAHTAAGGAGLVVGDDGRAVLGKITPLLAAHRVWERFPAGA